MKNTICIIISIAIFGIILHSEFSHTIGGNEALIAKYEPAPVVDYGELKIDGVWTPDNCCGELVRVK